MKLYKIAFALGITSMPMCAVADTHTVKVDGITYHGSIKEVLPVMVDTVNVKNNAYSVNSALDYPINIKTLPAKTWDGTLESQYKAAHGVQVFSFPLTNREFSEIGLKVSGAENYKAFIDGKPFDRKIKLTPGTREIVVKALVNTENSDTISFTLEVDGNPQAVITERTGKRMFSLDDVIFGDRPTSVAVSPSGKYAVIGYSKTGNDKRTKRSVAVKNLATGENIRNLEGSYRWLPDTDILWYTDTEINGNRNLMNLDPVSGNTWIMAENIPQGSFTLSPDLTNLIFYVNDKGPEEDKDIYRVLEPEDRQPGWRDRTNLAIYNIITGIYRPLTFGSHNVNLSDISYDGSKIAFGTSRSRLEKRPTTVFSVYILDIESMKVDTIVENDGFIGRAVFSPDGKKLAVTGSPEAFAGVGKNLPEGKIPSMVDNQLFIVDIATKEVTPVTKNFNPSVNAVNWNKGDGKIYFTAEDKDLISLFSYNPTAGTFEKINVPEDIVESFSIAEKGVAGAVIGESASNSDRIYRLDFKKGKPAQISLIEAPMDEYFDEVALGEVVDWNFVNSVGDTINGRYILPPGFDSSKKYPMIVNYYGGCSPTSKNFHTRYPHHLYANMGYIVYVINPSGATGFGQEFSSRHVNTAGEGVARDIIEGTLEFCNQHPYVDKDKIGCIGASYGGFMTQYLQTVTDIFAAAISHAGISDHTSYWGNGYWGYSYSEVAMAENYPWSNPDLFVKQSPLYNAHKVKTPILFLHGDEDTNVPPAESIQMFTALKLLGKDAALVEVNGQNHHILDFDKRRKWQDTIFAWFAKYLQDNPQWWESMYPETSL